MAALKVQGFKPLTETNKISNELVQKFTDPDKRQKAYTKWFRENKDYLWPLDRYKYIDEGGVYTGSQSVHNPGKEGYRYDVIHPKTKKPTKQPLMGYRFPKETMDQLIDEEKVIFGDDESKIVELKLYAKEYQEKLSSVIELDGRLGAYDLRKLFPDSKKAFTNPKPNRLLTHLLAFVVQDDDIVIDFFAGSGSTAHAVFDLNNKDGKNRKFILVQLPEPTNKNDYSTIADIGKERIRRVIKKIEDKREGESAENQIEMELEEKSQRKLKLDLGFKVFKLDRSNFKVWNSPEVDIDPDDLEEQLDVFADHISPEAEQESILYELILKSGYPLTTSIEEKEIEGKTIYSIEDDALLIFLDEELTFETLDQMSEMEPNRVVCLDKSFRGQQADALKTNAVQLFKSQDIAFRTV